jgi:hypothetical protein
MIYKNSVLALQGNRLLLRYRNQSVNAVQVPVYCENHTKHKIQSVGRMRSFSTLKKEVHIVLFFYLVCEAIGTAATPALLCHPRVIVKMIVEKQMECRLAGETEVL